MKRMLLIIALMAVAFSGCMEKQPSSSGPSAEELSANDLNALMLNSTHDLDSYKFRTESVQEMTVQNRSTNDGNASTIRVTSIGAGDVDLLGRVMSMVQTVDMVSDNNTAPPGRSETYILNDTIYMGMDGNWSSIKLPDADQIWARQNMVWNQADLLNRSELVILGSEKFEGQDAYKVKVTPDIETYSIVLTGQVGSILPIVALNISEMYKNSPPEWTAWISKEGYYLLKNEILMNLTVTPEAMGLVSDEVGDFEMDIDLATTAVFQDFNQPVEISLPEEAKNTTTITLLPNSAVAAARTET